MHGNDESLMGCRVVGERQGELTGELRQRVVQLKRAMLACIIGLSAVGETSLGPKQGTEEERRAYRC